MAKAGSLDFAELRTKIAHIITWKSGTRRAPHKPLQLLLMVAHIQKGGGRLLPFTIIEPNLRAALAAFGPVRKSNHPEYPFWHLKNDEIWEVRSDREIALRQQSANPTAKELRSKNAVAGFVPRYYEALKASASLQNDLIHDILDTHFPASIHENIINFFGLTIHSATENSPQDEARFRHEVLSAYDGVCAISNFNVKLEGPIFGVEAAHLLWPQAGGQSVVRNAIAMTTLHRKLFHLGVFTIDSSYRICVSKLAKGSNGFNDLVGQFDGKKISLPADVKKHPDCDALSWHRSEVFRH